MCKVGFPDPVGPVIKQFRPLGGYKMAAFACSTEFFILPFAPMILAKISFLSIWILAFLLVLFLLYSLWHVWRSVVHRQHFFDICNVQVVHRFSTIFLHVPTDSNLYYYWSVGFLKPQLSLSLWPLDHIQSVLDEPFFFDIRINSINALRHLVSPLFH